MDYSNQTIDVNYKDINSNTPLHHFVNHSKRDSLLRLLNQGANPNIKNKNGESPLYLATKQDQIEMIADLLNKGADTKDFKAALLDILEAQSKDSVEILSFVKKIDHKGWVAHILLELAALEVNLDFDAYYCATLILKAVWSDQHIRVFDALLRTQPSLFTRENDNELNVINYLGLVMENIKEEANQTTDSFQSWLHKAAHSIYTIIGLLKKAQAPHRHMAHTDINIKNPLMHP